LIWINFDRPWRIVAVFYGGRMEKAGETGEVDEKQFLGVWRIVSWENEDESGEISYPVGRRPGGLPHYAAGGHMLVQIAASGRARISTGELFGGGAGERAAAFSSHVAYGGRWEIRGRQMIHMLEISSVPNWTGGEQIRDFEFLDGDNLQLSAEMQFAGRTVMARVHWRRA
jgi:hypothetical protein